MIIFMVFEPIFVKYMRNCGNFCNKAPRMRIFSEKWLFKAHFRPFPGGGAGSSQVRGVLDFQGVAPHPPHLKLTYGAHMQTRPQLA